MFAWLSFFESTFLAQCFLPFFHPPCLNSLILSRGQHTCSLPDDQYKEVCIMLQRHCYELWTSYLFNASFWNSTFKDVYNIGSPKSHFTLTFPWDGLFQHQLLHFFFSCWVWDCTCPSLHLVCMLCMSGVICFRGDFWEKEFSFFTVKRQEFEHLCINVLCLSFLLSIFLHLLFRLQHLLKSQS